jgi:hypothetical protein
MPSRLDIGDGIGLDKFVTRLVSQDPQRAPLPELPAAAPIGAARGEGRAVAERRNPVGSLGTQDLTETAFANRTYWPDELVSTSDGMFSFVIKPIKEVFLTDSVGTPAKWTFADPSP